MTLGNFREIIRFSQCAWRLAALLPCDLVSVNSTVKCKLMQFAMGLIFEGYNNLLQSGVKIKCSDGHIRNCVICYTQHQGDQPAIDTVCSSIQVLYISCMCCVNCVLIVFCFVAGELSSVYNSQAALG